MGFLDKEMYGYKLRAGDTLPPPSLQAILVGTTGGATYNYVAVFVSNVGETTPSEILSVTTGNATLSPTNLIRLSCVSVADGATSIKFYKKHIDNTYRLLGVSTPSANVFDDDGSVDISSAATPPTTNTSGRPEWRALLWNNGKYWQRPEGMDQQWLHMRDQKNAWDTIHRNGDIISGLQPVPYDIGASKNVTGATNATPIVVTCEAHGHLDGSKVVIAGVLGNTAANGTFLIANATDDTFEITSLLGVDIAGNGNYTSGGTVALSENRWRITEGVMYLEGQHISVPEGIVSVPVLGDSKVGISVTPRIEDYLDDSIIRNIDELVDQRFEQTGADRLVYDLAWGTDVVGQVVIYAFYDGSPKIITPAIERTELEKKIAQGIFDVSGNFSVENFPLKVEEYADDSTKLTLVVDPGYVYANGFPVKTASTKRFQFDKARDILGENEVFTDVFSITGGDCVGTVEGPFNVEGKSIKFKVGNGNYHTVALTGSAQTASQVGAQIIADLTTNGYSSILSYNATTILQLQAESGKSLEIATLTSDDAAPILGLAAGTYEAEGTRIYQLNDYYIKNVTDMSYRVEQVLTMTRGASSYDAISDLSEIVGIADVFLDCHDGKYNYESGDDYQKSTIESVGTCIDWSLGGDEQPGTGNTYYAKVLVSYEPTKAVRRKCRAVDVPITRGSNAGDRIDDLLFTGASSITRTAINPATGLPFGTAVTLTGDASDVISIVSVNSSQSGLGTPYSTYTFLKNSGALAHDTSQLQWDTTATPTVDMPDEDDVYYVTFDFWQHYTEGDVVVADSYDSYPDIEVYAEEYLRDQLDFRTTGTLPAHGEAASLDYEYYLARIDKLICDDLGNMTILRGSPARTSPIVPPDKDGMISLAILLIAPYTYNTSGVTVRSIESMRITQRGLHELQKQVDWLRYYLIKNTLEQQRSNETAQITGDIKGMFVDALTGFGNTDLNYEKAGIMDIDGENISRTIRRNAAIDMQLRQIRLPATKTEVIIESDLDDPTPVTTGVRRLGNSLLLDYDPVVLIEQNKAGITINAAPDFVFENYVGHMALSPETDVFIDQTQLPALHIEDADNNLAEAVAIMYGERFAEIDWGNWHTTSGSGVSVREMQAAAADTGHTDPVTGEWVMGTAYTATFPTFFPWNIGGGAWDNMPASYVATPWNGGVYAVTHTVTGTEQREGTRTNVLPGTITRDLGNLVVDMSLMYNMRTTNADGSPFEIHVSCTGLLPNSDHCLTVAGLAVDFTYDSGADGPVIKFGQAGTHTYQGKTTVRADNNGKLTGKFTMPSGVSVGTADVKCFLYTGETNSYAASIFYSQGFNVSQRETTIGIPSIECSQESFTETGDLVFIQRPYYDPIAQSFFIPTDGSKYRYISEADVYFKSVSATKPITVQIRDMVNGIPGKQEFATATIDPEKTSGVLFASDDGSVATKFIFDKVIGYTAGTEYCLLIMPGNNNTEYEVFVSELGTMDYESQTIINTQANPGVLLHSPNGSTWEPWTKRDLKFKLYESNFTNNMQVMWKTLTGIQASQFCLIVNEYFGPGAEAKWFYSLDAGTTWIPTSPRIDTELSQVITQVWLKVDVTSSGGVYCVTDKYGGVLVIYNEANAFHVIPNNTFSDILNYPNKVSFIFDVAADMSVRKVTPYYSTDDGLNWVKVNVPDGYEPTLSGEPFYNYKFETPVVATITDATNSSPIIITSANHGFENNAEVIIVGVGGNTAANNGGVAMRLKNVTANTAELYALDGTTPIVGNSAYTDTGTMTLNEFSQCRGLLLLQTSNRALTPKVSNLAMSCYREAS